MGRSVPIQIMSRWNHKEMRIGKELQEILEQCHMGPTGGHYEANIIVKKNIRVRIYWPTIFKDDARLATPYHPQISGQTESTNRAIKCILERTVNGNRKEWVDKLDDALWAFKTAYKSPIVSTPFRIVYGKACHLPIEMKHKAYWALKNVNLDLDTTGKHRYLQLNKLAKLRNEAYEHSRAYKERTKRWHDAKIMDKEFYEGEEVLIFNFRLKIFTGKLKTRWYGPYTIKKVFPYGTVKVRGKNGVNFKVNEHRLKKYDGGDINALRETLYFESKLKTR
ncbi:reverse transcriptase domain-containing protein [Tanacetum coccineum]